MDGLLFQTASAPPAINPARADIACFVGLIGRRAVPAQRVGERTEDWLARVLGANVYAGLTARGWTGGDQPRTPAELAELFQVPVTLDSWDAFDRLFAWDQRPLNGTGELCTAALGAAVRSFFTQGGRRCHVVCTGDPLPVDALRAERQARLAAILPSAASTPAAARKSWQGIEHLYGLPDTSFLCVPDLPELFGVDTAASAMPIAALAEEKFKPLAQTVAASNPPPPPKATIARCDEAGFASWAKAVVQIRNLIFRHAKEAQFIAALPLAIDEVALGGKARSAESAARIHAARQAQWAAVDGFGTAFVQLAYPWLRTAAAERLPGEIEAPDGVLAGVLAHHALSRGTWLSALRTTVPDLRGLEPVLDRATLERPVTNAFGSPTVREIVSLFAPSPTGIRLLSDVTTHHGPYRPANIGRLVSAIARAARIVGEESVFENNGEALWRRLTDRLNALLTELWRTGVFAGESPAEAFEVRCDRSTMTQADLDSGRTIVRIAFTAAAPIERLVVLLAMDDGGQVSLLSIVGMEREGA